MWHTTVRGVTKVGNDNYFAFFFQRASFSLTKIGHMLPIGQRYAQPILKTSDAQVTPK